MVQWDLPKAVGLHGAPISGSCTVTAYPRPQVLVITSTGCQIQKESIPIERHTTKVLFTISNVTKVCEQIHCYIPTFGELDTTKLLIVGKYSFSFPHQFFKYELFSENVLCGSKRRQIKSVNMLTALERGGSMITSQRLNIADEHDTKDDHDDASYTAGNSSPMITCNKLIIFTAIFSVVVYIKLTS